MKLKLTCHPDDSNYELVPDVAILEVDESFKRTLKGMHDFATAIQRVDSSFYRLSRFDYTPDFYQIDWAADDDADDLDSVRVDAVILNVGPKEFWFTAIVKNTNQSFTTAQVSINGLEPCDAFNVDLP